MKGETIFINGKYVSGDNAVLPADDRAVMFGDSVFETVRAYDGTPFRLDRHLARLYGGCRALGIEPPVSSAEISEAVGGLVRENACVEGGAYVRITVTGGVSAGPKRLRRSGKAGIFIMARRYEPDPALYGLGITVVLSELRRNATSPLSRAKTGNYLDSLAAKEEALSAGADDAVMLDTDGLVAEATTSNIFVVREGVLATPAIGGGLLPGITREAVLETAAQLGVETAEVREGASMLESADEMFLTNSMVELLPVRKMGETELVPVPGPVTGRLMKSYRELVRKETGFSRPGTS